MIFVSVFTFALLANLVLQIEKSQNPLILFRDSAHIFISVLLQPLTATIIVGKNFFDFRVEFCGMIHLFSVAQFVNNNAVDNFIR